MKLMDRVREYYDYHYGVPIMIVFEIADDLKIKKYSPKYLKLYNKVKVYCWRIRNQEKLLLGLGKEKNVTSPGIEGNGSN